ncbi:MULTISPECIES: ABC transporter substrate-binding protein [unclassified Agarivorans]|uniref:ABC transporter substrate-binding protein n=1 Tax=unclassified Agarivorans TaxID=2636026 RepID=UPI003D7EA20B
MILLKPISPLLSAIFMVAITSQVSAQEITVIKDVKQTGKFTIANTLSYAPFEYIDENGKAAGFDIELATAAAKLMEAKLEIQTMPFSNQIPALVAGRNKVAWATFTVTEERLKQVDFVSFLQSGVVVVTTPNKAAAFKMDNALCGKTIALQTGSAADFVADKVSESCTAAGLEIVNKALYPEQKDTIQAVISGRVDARLDDSTAAGYFEKTTNGKQVVVGDAMLPSPLGVAIRKGDTETANMMKAIFDKLIADGTYANILRRYSLTTSAVNTSVIYTNASQLAD